MACAMMRALLPETAMTLAIFDLDNTLLAGDSDHAWGEYLVEQGHVDGRLVQGGKRPLL
jgi:phosphoserine phosphatase